MVELAPKNKKSIWQGLGVIVFIALLAKYFHNYIIIGGQKPVSEVVIALITGIFIKNLIGIGEIFQPGIQFVIKRVLKGAIILLGLSLSFTSVVATGAKALTIIIIAVTAALVITYLVGKWLNLSDKLVILIAVGTAICGSTAIASSSPAIKAREEETAFAVATITIFGVLAIFIYPLIGKMLELTDVQFGIWAGVAVHETAQVVAAGFAFSDVAGKLATIVKLTRTVLLVPLVLILGIFFNNKQKGENNTQVSLLRIFPWFAILFLLTACLRTIGDTLWIDNFIWSILLQQGNFLAKFMIIMAMAGLGLTTNFKDMKRIGIKPFIAGLIASVIMAVFSIILIFILGL